MRGPQKAKVTCGKLSKLEPWQAQLAKNMQFLGDFWLLVCEL